MTQAILATTYLGPIQYFTKLLKYDRLYIEQYDSYQKQSYRNRCQILGANGPLDLTIPIVKVSGEKTLVRDVKIDYSTQWQHKHWRSIEAAYNSSPFFEYFEVDFKPFYEKEWRYLIDFNLELQIIITDMLELQSEIQLTNDYVKDFDGDDYRNIISPKNNYLVNDSSFKPQVYTQTFINKYKFIPNLSILDLLFNTGPDAELILDNSSSSIK